MEKLLHLLDAIIRWTAIGVGREPKKLLSYGRGRGPKASSALKALEGGLPPGVLLMNLLNQLFWWMQLVMLGKIRPGDTVLMYNFRLISVK